MGFTQSLLSDKALYHPNNVPGVRINSRHREIDMSSSYRKLPGVDQILRHEKLQEMVHEYQWDHLVSLVRGVLEDARSEIRYGGEPPSTNHIIDLIAKNVHRLEQPSPTSVINATGVILHTNLGRSPLSHESLDAIIYASRSYSDLEFDLNEGKRGYRQATVETLICQLTGSESAFVVNNNAAAVLLGLAALASGREVVISRGEAVEIGGGFRIPTVLRQSGAILVEVGTTNRTYLSDYTSAINEHTAALLVVHPSNFRVTGFTYSPTLTELAELGKERNIPVLHDLGSGCLLDTSSFGLAHEHMPQESLKSGVPLAFFSGDKLLGGPQAGIAIGDRDLINKMKEHPLARAVRIDKMNLAALTTTLLHYMKGEALTKIPIWTMIAANTDQIKDRALRWQKIIGGQVITGHSTVGGGSLPGEMLPTWLLSLNPKTLGGPQNLSQALRDQIPPIVTRIEKDNVVLDPRTVLLEEEADLLRILGTIIKS
jgi:L-seryl-tRNA(Ser) seleniumtransferase